MASPSRGRHALASARAKALSGDLRRVARSGLAREKWQDDELILVGAPGLRDLVSASIVTFAQGATTRAITDQYFPERPIAMELGSIAAIIANARAGVGVALVSRRAAERELASKQLELIGSDRTPIVRSLYLVHRGRDRLSPATSELRKMLQRAAS